MATDKGPDFPGDRRPARGHDVAPSGAAAASFSVASPVKELHYFDRLEIKRTILDPKERRRVGKQLLSLDPWLVSYWLRARSDEWYARLFRGAKAKGLVAGEITPAYATLDESVLRRIKRLNDNSSSSS